MSRLGDSPAAPCRSCPALSGFKPPFLMIVCLKSEHGMCSVWSSPVIRWRPVRGAWAGHRLKDKGRMFREAFLAKLALLLRGTVAAPPERFGETLADEHIRGGARPAPWHRIPRRTRMLCAERGVSVWAEVTDGHTEETFCLPCKPARPACAETG